MKRVTVYLRTPLFTCGPDQGHVPDGTTVLEGEVEDQPAGGVLLAVHRARDRQGRDLGEVQINLYLPWAKVDHMAVHA